MKTADRSYLPINDRYRVTSDSRQWIVERHSIPSAADAKKGKTGSWTAIKYYMNWEQLSKAMKEMMLMESEYQSHKDLLKNAAAIAELMDDFHSRMVEVHGILK